MFDGVNILGFLDNSYIVTDLSRSYSSIVLAVCCGSLSWWTGSHHPCLRWHALWSRLSSRTSLYLDAFILPSVLTSLSVLAAKKHHHNMMPPPPCFIVGMVLVCSSWYSPDIAWRATQGVQLLFHQTRESFSSCSQSPLNAVCQTPSGLSYAF